MSAEAAPAPPVPARFELIDDAQVRELNADRVWTRIAHLGDKRMTWEEADAACKACRVGGHDDWRLPTRIELLTLVDDTRYDPAIDPIFECKSGWYWTATPWAPSPGDYAWYVGFSYGDASYGDRGSGGFVRAVRGGQ